MKVQRWVLWVLLFLFIAMQSTVLLAVAPTDVQVCNMVPNSTQPGALMGCTAVVFIQPASTDRVRWSNGTQQGWAIFSTLKPTDVVYERDGHWHLVSGVIPSDRAPPPVPPVLADYTVRLVTPDPSDVGAIFKQLPTNVPHCFQVTAGTQSITTCVPAAP